MSSCSAAEIAEKRRKAQEKLQAKKALVSDRAGTVLAPKKSDSILPQKTKSKFEAYHAPENKASTFLNALKKSNVLENRKEIKDAFHPYQRPASRADTEYKGKATNPLAPVFRTVVTCKMYMTSVNNFAVLPSAFHSALISVFKSIPSKCYDNNSRIWTFDVKDYQLLLERTTRLKPDIVVATIPKKILVMCLAPQKVVDRSCLISMEPALVGKLMPFQLDGVFFAIARHGRAMICDEMGLGKTYQALAIANFYKEDWPLLICTTASTRQTWAVQVQHLLPNVPLHNVQVLTNQQQCLGNAKIFITSYNIMERSINSLVEKNFGCLIYDESHMLKNNKAKCTISAERLAMRAKRVLLLSGTPALSRPVELFTQLQMIDRKFMNFMEFTTRYCDGKQTNFGWDATGQSNLEELKVLLNHQFMIRRLKSEVLPQLSEKFRETVYLDPALIWSKSGAKENIDAFAKNFSASKGKEKERILLQFYAETAVVKTRSVCAYLKTLMKTDIKFIVFAHHKVMMDAICECLKNLQANFIRIDGTTKNDHRAEYVNVFQNEPLCKVAVLSLKACNSGITLTAAELIVFAELDWNPSILAQAEGRAHRIGQEKPVTCRYLMAKNTADDVIWNMLKAKQEVLNQAGLFAENLQKAIHTAAPTMSQKIDEFFVSNTPEKEQVSHDEVRVSKHKDSCNSPCIDNLDELFNDDDDDAFKDLEF